MVACRYAKFNKTRSNVTSGGLGTMGFALPAAIGAKFGAQERDVVAIIGDGGFQMTLQELGTIMQSGVDVKIIILNNRFWAWCANGRSYLTSAGIRLWIYKARILWQWPQLTASPANVSPTGKDLPGALKEMLENKGSLPCWK